jgi:Chaperone of endosialidase
MTGASSPLFEIARVLVRFHDVALFIVNANHGIAIRLADLARICLNSAHMKTTTLPLRNSLNLSPLRAFLLIPLVLACFVLSPHARAVCQEGCLTNSNTVLGEDALFSLTTGLNNTAIGFHALLNNTTGPNNTAIGFQALYSNTTGSQNTAIGFNALHDSTGSDNTAVGYLALMNTTGPYNTAVGSRALANSTGGNANTAIGWLALENNTTGSDNTGCGVKALWNNTGGLYNTAIGTGALAGNRTGFSNTAVGFSALPLNNAANDNTAIGVEALLRNTGSSNIALGFQAGSNLTTGNNNIDIGHPGIRGESNTIRIGTRQTHTTTVIAGIRDITVTDGVAVMIDANGRMGTLTSSARFKEAIKPMDKASEAIFSLKPVTFRYKHELDSAGIPQFGLVAEEVEKVNPDLVARDAEGKAYTVRYEAVNAMLLNEFLKEHRKVGEEAEINRQQQASIARLEAIVKEQALQIQKVTAQLAAKNADPRLVNSD